MAAIEPKSKRPPKVRIAHPKGRPIQLRYRCPVEQREIRLSTNTHDPNEAERQKKELEAKLLLGIKPAHRRAPERGPNMSWEEFRDAYTTMQLATVRSKSAADAESRLEIAERILKPRTLADVANGEALARLQCGLLAGEQGKYNRPRSPHTVKGCIKSVLAALNWARGLGWLESVPTVQIIKTSKMRRMKGRPITAEEFAAVLEAVPGVVGEKAAQSWLYLLRGLWSSGLRIDELMHVSWDMPHMIVPTWPKGGLPVLTIPADMQKNDTEQDIPLLPWFENVLLETPECNRTGWAFEPISLQTRLGRRVRHKRLTAKWVGKVISSIGKAAGVVVTPPNKSKGTPAKYASAHDLRRSCAQRLLEAGVPPTEIACLLRHASWETTRKHYAPGETQKSAERIRVYLGTSQNEKDVSRVHPRGFEPLTFGSVDRCSIQLS
jgi:integrase